MADRSKRGPFQSISDVGHVARDARNILYESHLSYAIRSPSTLFRTFQVCVARPLLALRVMVIHHGRVCAAHVDSGAMLMAAVEFRHENPHAWYDMQVEGRGSDTCTRLATASMV